MSTTCDAMHVERVVIKNFRCFGPAPTPVTLGPGLAAFIGANGSGKTAVFQALLRLFGVTGEHRRVRRGDFHVPADETTAPTERTLSIDVVFAFPELAGDNPAPAVAAEFFRNFAATKDGSMKCRIRLDANWADDGSADGSIEEQRRVITTFDDDFSEKNCTPLSAADRARVQVIYVPALRDAASQVTAFLRGRLWRAINWSDKTRTAHEAAVSALQRAFATEPAVRVVEDALAKRWTELHGNDAYARPCIRPIDGRFGSFVRRSEIVFRPDGDGRDLVVEDLSDGQRSLLHIALVSAALDVERSVAEKGGTAFDIGAVVVPALTVVAVEEPENTLTPYYLTRIVEQLQSLSDGGRGQALISSHSASVLARVEPTAVRYFRLQPVVRTTAVRVIRLPDAMEDASKFVREAVRIFPEMYFARFVILGEGSTEEVVIPRLSAALGLPIDRALVALVPLGGRHVNHLWRLLVDLDIPHATLLDLDWGRDGGGWGRINTAYSELLATGLSPATLLPGATTGDDVMQAVDQRARDAGDDWDAIAAELKVLESFNVYYCGPLDLDWEMLRAYPAAYMVAPPGGRGPTKADARPAVFGDGGQDNLYGTDHDEALRWYRYLFLTRGKPSTHSSVLLGLNDADLRTGMPPVLERLLNRVAEAISVPKAGEA